MLLYLIIVLLIVVSVLDMAFKNQTIMKVFLFGLADPSKYESRKFRIIHSIGCLVAAALCLIGVFDNRPIWFILLVAVLIIMYDFCFLKEINSYEKNSFIISINLDNTSIQYCINLGCHCVKNTLQLPFFSPRSTNFF